MNLNYFLDINTVFFNVLNYPMSYVEFFGTIFTAWSVYLAAKNKVLSWPIGIFGIILYGFLFYQIQLYSDLLEQLYYFITSFWGWWAWTHPKGDKSENGELKVGFASWKMNLTAIISTFVFTIALGYFMSRVHILFPTVFSEVATFPYLDALTTVMSLLATVYLVQRKIENWYLWIIVDIIGVGLYYQKGVVFLSLLYFAFLINAVVGYLRWRKTYNAYETKEI